MTDAATWGWIGGIAGSLVGLAGGVFGTWCSLRNTRGRRERAFVRKAAAACWIALLGFLGLLLLLPWRWILWVPYGILLPVGIALANRRQQALRRPETEEAARRSS